MRWRKFSINEVVGPRTVETNGFVSAGAIENEAASPRPMAAACRSSPPPASTLAFFAGLDIPSYQFTPSNIGRYLYGRESTVSYPHRTIIENNTPYGVLCGWTFCGHLDHHDPVLRPVRRRRADQPNDQPQGSCNGRHHHPHPHTFVDSRTENDTFHGHHRNAGPTCPAEYRQRPPPQTALAGRAGGRGSTVAHRTTEEALPAWTTSAAGDTGTVEFHRPADGERGAGRGRLTSPRPRGEQTGAGGGRRRPTTAHPPEMQLNVIGAHFSRLVGDDEAQGRSPATSCTLDLGPPAPTTSPRAPAWPSARP